MSKQARTKVAMKGNTQYNGAEQCANLDKCIHLPTDKAPQVDLADANPCESDSGDVDDFLTWNDESTAVLSDNPKVKIRFAQERQEGYVDVVLGIVLKACPDKL